MYGKFSRRSDRSAGRLTALAAIVLATLTIVAAPLRAASYTWAVSTGDWSIASDWGSSILPTSSDTAYIVKGGTANVTQLGETCGTLSMGNSAGSGNLYMTGGSLAATNYEYVGNSGIGIFTLSGGTNTVSVAGALYLGNAAGSGGYYNLGGSGRLLASTEYVGYSGFGTFTQSAGSNTLGDPLYLGYQSGAVGTYNLNGGLLVLPGLNTGSGSSAFNFNGGTLQANYGFSTNMPMSLGSGGGGATCNTAGFIVSLSGSLSGPGGLTLNDSVGNGTLVLTASNTYTGATLISAGTLQVGNGGNGASIGRTSGVTDNASLIFYHRDVVTFSAAISGSGNLAQSGSGTLILTNSNSYTGTTTISFIGSTLQIGNGGNGASIGGTSGVTDDASLIFNHGDAITFNPPINGVGTLTQTGSGILILTNSNSYAGATTISGGTLQVGNGGSGASIGGTPAVVDNARLIFNHGDAVTFTPAITGSGTLTQTGSGVLILTNSNSYTGATTISGGTLEIGSGGYGASIASTSRVTDNSSLIFNDRDTVTLNSVITGSGTLTQTGSGNLILTNSNAYTGATTIRGASTLEIGNGGSGASIGSTSGVTDNASLIFNHGDTVVFNPVVSGSGSLTQSGSGVLILTNSNSYTGTTTIGGGTLQLGNGGSGASIGSTSGVTNSANLIFDGGDAVTFNAAISGSGNLTKIGSGSVTLTGVNSYSGTTTVNGGTLQIAGGSITNSPSQYVGYSGTGTITQSGGTNNLGATGTLSLGNSSHSNGSYNLGGAGTLSAPNQYVGYSGTGTLNQTGGTNNLGIISYLEIGYNSGSSGTYNLSGSGLLSAYDEYVGNSGMGTFAQSGGTNNVSRIGYLEIGIGYSSSGSYSLSGSGVLAATAEIVSYSGTGTFNQSGGTNNVGSNGSLEIADATYSNGSYNLTGSGLLSAPGEQVGYSGSGTITQTGGTNDVGALSLGINSGSHGNYILSGSGLLAASLESVGGSESGIGTLTQSGGTFTQSGGTNNLGVNGYLYLGYNQASNGSYNLSGSGLLSAPTEYVGYSGAGIFAQSGGTNSVGTLYVNYTSNANLSYNPSYNLTGSALLFASNEYVTGNSINSTAFTQSGGTNNVSSLYLDSSFYAGYGLSGSGLLSANSEYLDYASAFTQSGGTNKVASSFSLEYGTYNLTGGALLVPGIQGYGTFNFNGGTLQATNSFSTSLPMTLGTSGGGATFDTAGNSVTLSGSLSGPGSLTLNDSLGTGTLILTASNTYAGGTTVSAGTLQLGDGVANNGYIQGNILNNAAMVFANPAAQTYSGMVSGSGSLTKASSGTLWLSGSSTLTGPTTVNQGELVVDGWLTNSPVSVNSGGTLGGTGYLSNVTVSPTGQIAPGDSLGTLTVGGTLSLSGSLILEAGAVMDYELDTPSTSDMIDAANLALNNQQFTDFSFTLTVNFKPGHYDLIAFSSYGGSLGAVTSGTIDGRPATLAISGNDLLLTVVPEPSTLALLGAGVLGVLTIAARWRKRELLGTAANRVAD